MGAVVTRASPAEREMRDVVAAYLRAALPDSRIVHELVAGECRADLAAIQRDKITLVELKSEKDTLKRAERQMRAFDGLAHQTILVAHVSFFDRSPYESGQPRCAATDELRSFGGELWVYPQPPANATAGEGLYYKWHFPRPNLRQPRAFDFLNLMWRAEMVQEAKRHGIDATRKMDMSSIAAAMAWRMTGREIAEAVCRQLRRRSFPEADPPPVSIEAPKLAAHGKPEVQANISKPLP